MSMTVYHADVPRSKLFISKESAREYLDKATEVLRPMRNSAGRIMGWFIMPVVEHAKTIKL